MGKNLFKTVLVGGAIAATGYVVYKRLDQKQQTEIQNGFDKLSDDAKGYLEDAQYAVNDLVNKAGLDEQVAQLTDSASAASENVQKHTKSWWHKAQKSLEEARQTAEAKKDDVEETIVVSLDNLNEIEAEAKAQVDDIDADQAAKAVSDKVKEVAPDASDIQDVADKAKEVAPADKVQAVADKAKDLDTDQLAQSVAAKTKTAADRVQAAADRENGLAESGKAALSNSKKNGLADSGKTGLSDTK